METTEKIVEAYVRYVKHWATIPNLRCNQQKEIDLFAIDPATNERWHIETSVSISSGFSKLTAHEYEPDEHKIRNKQAGARRKLGFFQAQKFDHPAVIEKLVSYGCDPAKLRRAIVTWDCDQETVAKANGVGIDVWKFPDLMQEIAKIGRGNKAYLGDDTLRTITLFERGLRHSASA